MHTYLCVSASSHTTGLSRPATPARSRRNVVRSMQKSSRRAPSCARWHLVRRAIIGGDGGRPGVTPLVALHVFSHAPVDACRAPGALYILRGNNIARRAQAFAKSLTAGPAGRPSAFATPFDHRARHARTPRHPAAPGRAHAALLCLPSLRPGPRLRLHCPRRKCGKR